MRFVAGQGAEAEHLVRGAAVAERHREEAGRGAVTKSHREEAVGREPIKTIIGKYLLAKAHKNLDFVLEKPENGGPEG